MFHSKLKNICKTKGIMKAPDLYRMMLDAGFRGSERTVRYWWDGKRAPSYKGIQKLAETLNVQASIFF